MNDFSPSESDLRKAKTKDFDFVVWAILIGLCVLIFGVSLSPVYIGIKNPLGSITVEKSRTIALAMFQYANDHSGKYPDGKRSTDVFQQLLDGDYVSDPALFYMPMPGKVRPRPGQKLWGENVCWDVTSGLDAGSSDELPVVFLTGYRVHYIATGAAEPLIKPFPKIGFQRAQAWYQQLLGLAPEIVYSDSGGLAVTYKTNSAMFKRAGTTPETQNVVPEFISKDFKPDGETHQQLTPDGELP